MAPRTTSPALTLPGPDQSYGTVTIPELSLPQTNGSRGDLAKVEDQTHLHIAVMYAHERKAECFIEVNVSTAEKSGDAFSSFARSSESRVKEAKGMMFEKDVQLVEHSLRQSCFSFLDANIRDTARQTGMVAARSVLPMPEEKPKKGFFARLFG